MSSSSRPPAPPSGRRIGFQSCQQEEDGIGTLPHDGEEGRPVPRRTRPSRPNSLPCAGTYQCNLTCPHCCVPIEWTDRLDVAPALRFLEDAHDYGIEVLGFTG